MRYFIANWKAHKDFSEALSWIDTLLNKVRNDTNISQKLENDLIKIIIAPPFPLLHPIKGRVAQLKNIFLAAQDISHFNQGPYTGEVSAKSLSGIVDFVIIGHSERRQYFNENNQMLREKVEKASQYHIESIFCLRNEKDTLPKNANIIAYEPVYAIGTGNNEEPEKVLEMKKKLELSPGQKFLYGGSTNKDNASSYLRRQEIDGFLVGTASLDPLHFYQILSLS